MHKHEALELEKRGALSMDSVRFVGNTIIISSISYLKTPTFWDKIKAYLTLTIPAAMLARVVRKTRNRKGTVLEKQLMDYYYDMSVKLLKKD